MVVEWKLLVWGGFAGMGGVSFLALSALYFDMDTIRTTINLIMLGACVPLVRIRTKYDKTYGLRVFRHLLDLNAPRILILFKESVEYQKSRSLINIASAIPNVRVMCAGV